LCLWTAEGNRTRCETFVQFQCAGIHNALLAQTNKVDEHLAYAQNKSVVPLSHVFALMLGLFGIYSNTGAKVLRIVLRMMQTFFILRTCVSYVQCHVVMQQCRPTSFYA